MNLEIDRYFRNNCYIDNNKFYLDFFSLLEKKYQKKINIFLKKSKNKFLFIKKNYKFYSDIDIKFRLVRDEFLSRETYTKIILNLMKSKKHNYKSCRTIKKCSICSRSFCLFYPNNKTKHRFNRASSKLLMSKKDLIMLKKNNHIIGLHSHTHPTNIDKLSYKDQLNEYFFNKKKLEKITKKTIFTASYPNGKYNKDSLKIFENLKINYSFISNMKVNKNSKFNNFAIPRQDHTNIISNFK